MVKLKYLIIALLVLGIGIFAGLNIFQSEEKRVKKQFHLLAESVSKPPGETPIAMAQKLKNVGPLFSENCGLDIPSYSLTGRYSREEIAGYAAKGRSYFSELSLRFYDLVVTFPEAETAKATLTARVTGKSNMGEQVNEAHELESVLKKTEKKWLFSQFSVVEVLKK